MRILELDAVQSPFNIGLDSSSRDMFSCNYSLSVIGSDVNVTDEIIAKILLTANIAVTGNIFIGASVNIPQNTDGPYISINLTSGFSPLLTHNDNTIYRPSIQIITRAKPYRIARNKAMDVFKCLSGVRNLDITL